MAELCIRLDGLPLALELAAAHMRAFTPTTLASMLQREQQALRGTLDTPTRQQCYAQRLNGATICSTHKNSGCSAKWQYFSGDCTLESARAISRRGGAGCPGGCRSLVDKSLLECEPDADGRTRFRMLETIRGVATRGFAR